MEEVISKVRDQVHEQFKMELDLLNKERDNLKQRNTQYLKKIEQLELNLANQNMMNDSYDNGTGFNH